MQNLHPTQIGILNRLLFAEKLRFTDLKIDPEIENNTFQFHLTKVIELGYVQKDESGYYLTEDGKIIANYIDNPKNEFTINRKSSVRLFCLRDNKENREVLIKTRFKHPFYGGQGFPTGKILEGEQFVDAAKRVAQNELNLRGVPVLFRIIHYLVKNSETNRLLDDKLFFDFYINNPTGQLSSGTASHFEWILASDFNKHMTKPIGTIKDYKGALELIANFTGTVKFSEVEHFTDKF